MVKNVGGGNKSKGFARKNVTSNSHERKLRISFVENEMYSMVTAYLGNSMCHVLCIDGVTRLCHIRGKFKGRGKRDNFVTNGSWLLVGLREWTCKNNNSKNAKLEECDLLEVYSDEDKNRLKDEILVNWNIFQSSSSHNHTNTIDTGFEFSDDTTDEYMSFLENEITNSTGNSNKIKINDNINDDINIDDI